MRLSCRVIEDILPIYFDGICSEESTALVEAHLKDCPHCSHLLSELRSHTAVPGTSVNDMKPLKKIRRRYLKMRLLSLLLVLCMAHSVISWLGVGPYFSSSAAADLRAELESVYGSEYIGKPVEDGTEDMVFEVVPQTRFLTNQTIRSFLGLDYKYECCVIFTTYTGENSRTVRTVTYQAADPMGPESITQRASIDWGSRTEKTQ